MTLLETQAEEISVGQEGDVLSRQSLLVICSEMTEIIS